MFDWIDETSLSSAVLAFGAMQWAHTAGFIAALRAQVRRGRESPGRLPAACVILAAKGTMPDFEGNIRSILEQEYPGPVEYLFVTPRESDPAYGAIRGILAGYPGKTVRLLHSDETPATSCGKITDLLYALRAAPPGTEVLAFADCDIRVRQDWLLRMVEPLRDPGVVAVITHALYVPRRAELSGLLRLACGAFVASSMYLGRVVGGWSWAVRRADFFALGIPERWRTSLTDDTSLDAVFARDGRRIRWAALAGPAFTGGCSLAGIRDDYGKSFLYLRLYDFPVWLFMSLALGWTAYAAYWALVFPVKWRLLALVLGVNMLNVFAIFAALRRYLPRQFDGIHPAFRTFPLLAALCAPAMWVVFLAAWADSAFRRRLEWGGRVYRIHAPDRIEVVG